ncbi:MAG TPA: hypothetical protein VFH54_06040 [Mycobacteriales bacterium]|nr:hypothetical protein [Mycobacteriales bacterium]
MTERDALWEFHRALEAERRHANPERTRREALLRPASPEAIQELVDAVAPRVTTADNNIVQFNHRRRSA